MTIHHITRITPTVAAGKLSYLSTVTFYYFAWAFIIKCIVVVTGVGDVGPVSGG